MIELLAPGGNKQAIENAAYYGADAVYFGVGSFNARAGADNLTDDQLPEILEFLHARSVKGYLALNILLRDHELHQALELARQAKAAYVDGIIVQDIGLAALIRAEFPTMPIHASTQMTITDRYGLERANELGLARVVLPRELNASSIADLTAYAREFGIETEVFVHGALCIAYSGQCLISGIKKGRSANRGQCSQPCRLSYGINEYHRPDLSDSICDRPEYSSPLISPKDQALIKYLPELIEAGVSSLKIEGRMRSADYTALVVSEYRKAIDQAFAGSKSVESDHKKLLIAYNRGGEFTDRYYVGRRDSNFVTGKYPGSYGFYIGNVEAVDPRQGSLKIQLAGDLTSLPARGDVLSVRTGSRETASAPIGIIKPDNKGILVKAFHPDVLKKIKPGEQVFQMSDNSKLNDIKKYAVRKIPVELVLEVSLADQAEAVLASVAISEEEQAGFQRATLNIRIAAGALAGLEAAAEKVFITTDKTLPEDRVRQQLAKTGATQFAVDSILLTELDGTGVRFSISDLNSLRREAIKTLEQAMIDSFKITVSNIEPDKTPGMTMPKSLLNDISSKRVDQGNVSASSGSRIDVWYQRLPDDPGEIACGADCYILPLWSLADNKGKPWIDVLKQEEPDSAIFAWTPPAPQNEIAAWAAETIRSLADIGIDGICSSHPGAASLIGADLKLQVDSGLNITNRKSAELALSNRPDSLTFSSELLASQIYDIAVGMDNEMFRQTHLVLPVYGRQRLMSSVYCPVGQNVIGCKKCHLKDTAVKPDNAKLYDLCDQNRKKMILQTHPLFCTTDIFDSSVLLDIAMLTKSWPVKTAWRLHMLDESYQERLQLVRAMRKLTDDMMQEHSANTAELEQLVRRIADRIADGSVDTRRKIYE